MPSTPITLLASAATAAGAVTETGSAVQVPGYPSAVLLMLDVTAASTDAADTLNVTVQTLIDGTNWVDVCAFTEVLGNGGALRHVAKVTASAAVTMFVNADLAAGNIRNILADQYRVKYAQADGDSNGSFTFSVTALAM